MDRIVRLDAIDTAYAPWAWPFAREREGDIAEHFAQRRRATPALWNGRVLLLRQPEIVGGVLRGAFFDTGFAEFIAWKDWGARPAGAVNCFAMGALRGSDGAFLMGVMGAHTASPGHIYFPAGTPDLDDVVETAAGPVVDIAANVRREVEEETGLTAADFTEARDWTAVFYGERLALMKVLDLAEPAEVVREGILAHLARETQPELADIKVVRGLHDIEPQMPGFVTAYLHAVWG